MESYGETYEEYLPEQATGESVSSNKDYSPWEVAQREQVNYILQLLNEGHTDSVG